MGSQEQPNSVKFTCPLAGPGGSCALIDGFLEPMIQGLKENVESAKAKLKTLEDHDLRTAYDRLKLIQEEDIKVAYERLKSIEDAQEHARSKEGRKSC